VNEAEQAANELLFQALFQRLLSEPDLCLLIHLALQRTGTFALAQEEGSILPAGRDSAHHAAPDRHPYVPANSVPQFAATPGHSARRFLRVLGYRPEFNPR
jgi:hypothetical protein